MLLPRCSNNFLGEVTKWLTNDLVGLIVVMLPASPFVVAVVDGTDEDDDDGHTAL